MKSFFIVGTIACTLAGSSVFAQTASQAIPDAPRPQTTLPPVTPGIGTPAASSSTDADTAAPASEPGQSSGAPTLASAPKPARTATDRGPVQDPVPADPQDGQAPEGHLTTMIRHVNFVEVPFTVKDRKGGLVAGIDWREVQVFENGVRQHMQFWNVDPTPLSVALVIDQSVDYHTMQRINDSLGALPAVFAPYDEVAVFTYNNGPRERTAYTAGTSARLSAVLEQSKSTGRDPIYFAPGEALGGPTGININGGADKNTSPLTEGGPASPYGIATSQVPREPHTLNDAILMAAESLTHAAKGRRRIVYVISDGKEFGSKAKTKDVIKYLQTNNIGVYATLTGDSSVEGLGFVEHVHLPLMMRDNLLPIYTAATGGQTFAEFRTRGIETSFQKITEEVRNQYTVGFYSSEPLTDGKFRTLEVRVLRPGLDVIAKKGYYPTPQATTAPAYRQTAAQPQ